MSDLRGALERHDAEALAQVAHGLKGSIGNFCASQAFDAAYALENIGDSGNLSPAEEAYSELEEQVERLANALQDERVHA